VGPVDLEVAAGECWVVIGPNGAGKTSLLRLLAGILPPSHGHVELQGSSTDRNRRETARRIAYVPQLRPLSVPLSVEEVVLSGRYPYLDAWQWAPAASDRAAIDHALDLVGLTSLRDRSVDRLSGGERQAVYIAAALAQEAEILILDEPTTHLDPRHQRDIARLVGRLRDDGRHGLVVATHDLAFGAALADHALALSRGAVFARGRADDVFQVDLLGRLFETRFSLVDSKGATLRGQVAMPVIDFRTDAP
jgi:iron complex transport system ATP-binding protein